VHCASPYITCELPCESVYAWLPFARVAVAGGLLREPGHQAPPCSVHAGHVGDEGVGPNVERHGQVGEGEEGHVGVLDDAGVVASLHLPAEWADLLDAGGRGSEAVLALGPVPVGVAHDEPKHLVWRLAGAALVEASVRDGALGEGGHEVAEVWSYSASHVSACFSLFQFILSQ